MPQLAEPVLEQVMMMLEQGYDNNEIVAQLQEQGYTNQEIQEALNQAHTKASIETEPQLPPSPPTPQMQPSLLNAASQPPQMEQPTNIIPPPPQESQVPSFASRDVEERMEEIAEAIIDEKWRHAIEEIGDLAAWKDKVKTELIAIKQEVLRMENRFDGMQQSILGRMKDYDHQVEDVGTDIKAVEKLLESILRPLAENVKELKKITDKLRK